MKKTSLAAVAIALCATHPSIAAKLPFLRGVNINQLEGTSYYSTSSYRSTYYLSLDSTYSDIKAKGFDHVRLPVDFRNYYDSSTKAFKTSGNYKITDIDTVINKALNAGLYVTLDFHGWYIDDSVVNSDADTEGTDANKFVTIWGLVADRYKDYSDKLNFEIVNEPHVASYNPNGKLDKLQAKTLARIRQTNPTRLVLWAVSDGCQPWLIDNVTLPADHSNVGIVIHCYNPGAFTHQGATWANSEYDHQERLTDSHRSTLQWDLNKVQTWHNNNPDVPIVFNEFAVHLTYAEPDKEGARADVQEYLGTVRAFCESNDIAWAYWQYCDNGATEFAIRKNYNTDWREYVVEALFPPGWDDPEPEPDPGPVVYGQLATNLYAKSMNVLFAGVQDNVTLTNFPVLVKLSTAISGFSYSDFAKANGGDLRFADADGTLLPHEIDTWNPSGVSTVWVKVPLLKKKSYITAHYGFAGSGDPAPVAAKDVWDDDYVGVWHLGESALPMKESSETSSDFETSYGSTIGYAAPGIVGNAVDFPTNGTYNALVAPDHDALDGFTQFTIEYWTFQDEHKQDAGILSKRKAYNNDAAYYFYDTRDANSGTWSMPFCIGTNKSTSARWSFNLSQTLGEWNHIVYSADMSSTSKNVHGFKNGTMNGWEPNVTFFGPMPNSDEPLVLGNLGANKKDNSFNGQIDEVRISKTVRSKEWVKATYETIANDGFAVCSFGEIDFGENITNLLLKASTDKANPIDYKEGDNIRFDFWLDGVVALPLEVKAKEPLHVIWTRTADDGVTVKGTNTISLAEGFSINTSLAVPGIVKMTGTLVGSDYKAISYVNPSDGNTKNITFGGGAGVATEKMQMSSVEPADFDQFWREAKQKLATVPFEGQVELVDVTPNNLTNNYYIYAAKVPCFGPRPVTGWLTVPRKPQAGGVPIQANFDGYGCATAAPKVPTYGAGQLVRFAVNAHGYDMIGHDNQYYQDFSNYINYTNRTFNGTRYGYALAPQDYDNPTNTYFYYMAMRVMRAFDYLKTRPEWNGRDVIAEGGSQGGLQTMWAGGLVDGITKIRPGITWGCDIGDPYPNNPGPLLSRSWGIPSVEGAFYFDSALHAKRVPRDCLAQITRLGMGDYTCPPRGVLLSYYNMKCQVSAYLVQGSDHGYIPPSPNQTFTIQKAAEPEPPPPPSAVASDAAGFDYTNRVVTVTNAAAGATLTLTATASDGTTTSATATASANGEATFDIATLPGTAYDYVVEQDGVAAATGGFFTGGWDAGGAWFSASAESGSSVVSGGDWKDSAPRIESGKYMVGDAPAEFGLSPVAAEAGSNGFVRIDFACAFDSFCDAVGLAGATEDGIVVFTAATNAATGGKALWMAYGSAGWKPLYGDIAPEEGASYGVRAEVDLAANPPRVRYSVRADAGDVFVPLFMDDACTERWGVGAESRAAVSSVSFDGSGSVTSLLGALSNSDVAEADGVGYASLADAIAASTNSLALLTNATWPSDTPVGTIAVNLGGHSLAGVTLDGSGKVVVGDGYSAIPGEGKINISLAQAAALGVSTDGKSPAQIASALAENGANGIPRWKSYALGLDPADATAKPRATIAMNGENVELRLVGITVNTASGATVTYKVYKSADLADMANAEPASDAKAVDATASVPKGASEDRMFYQLKVDVKGY